LLARIFSIKIFTFPVLFTIVRSINPSMVDYFVTIFFCEKNKPLTD
jgi:hypothetical protein